VLCVCGDNIVPKSSIKNLYIDVFVS